MIRRLYIRVWLWWNNFCPKHGLSNARYNCSECDYDKEKAAEEARKRYRAERGLLMDKAGRLVKEL